MILLTQCGGRDNQQQGCLIKTIYNVLIILIKVKTNGINGQVILCTIVPVQHILSPVSIEL